MNQGSSRTGLADLVNPKYRDIQIDIQTWFDLPKVVICLITLSKPVRLCVERQVQYFDYYSRKQYRKSDHDLTENVILCI